jgi:hypothetical protein
MRVSQHAWSRQGGWKDVGDKVSDDAQLVFYFSGPEAWPAAKPHDHLRALYPGAHLVGCTTGGEILGRDVSDHTVAATALHFERTRVRVATTAVPEAAQSQAAGRALAQGLPRENLRAVFVLADGISTNGSALIAGLRQVLPEEITITGGLAGDGADFRATYVGCDGPMRERQAVAVGFYGDAVRVGWGSFGGWDRFGPARRITQSRANVLYELDGEPALTLYRRYLGDQADLLPGSGLLFPLTVRPPNDEDAAVVRTIVGIDDATHSMTFAGDIPEGWTAQLMRGNFDGLVEGACSAADAARTRVGATGETVSLLVSCIGRKLLMGQRIIDEVEAAADILGPASTVTGFYSYGEIAPHGFTGRCELHNQTMTITTIGEG